MNAFKVTLLVIDHGNYGAHEIKTNLENEDFTNPKVMHIVSADIGEWKDSHPLNNRNAVYHEFDKLFSIDSTCICEGNWRNIIGESRPLFGRKYKDRSDRECTFIGVLDGEQDYYYTFMYDDGTLARLSCVGSIESFGYTLQDTNETIS